MHKRIFASIGVYLGEIPHAFGELSGGSDTASSQICTVFEEAGKLLAHAAGISSFDSSRALRCHKWGLP